MDSTDKNSSKSKFHSANRRNRKRRMKKAVVGTTVDILCYSMASISNPRVVEEEVSFTVDATASTSSDSLLTKDAKHKRYRELVNRSKENLKNSYFNNDTIFKSKHVCKN